MPTKKGNRVRSEKRRLCPWCLKDYKAGAEGKKARKEKIQGKVRNWPARLYTSTDSGSRLCPAHQAKARRVLDDIFLERAAALRRIGFSSYPAYIKSPLWSRIRDLVFSFLGFDCHFCAEPGAQVHHGLYSLEILAGLDLSALYVVCDTCHKRGSFMKGRELLPPKQATRRMTALACQHGHTKHVRRKEADRRREFPQVPGEHRPQIAEEQPLHPDLVALQSRRKRSAAIVKKNRKRARKAGLRQ